MSCHSDQLRDVPDIELHAPRVGRVAAAADLPQPGQARLRCVVVFDVAAIARDLGAHDRTRPDQAHLAAQHVEQLRQLVEARAAQEAPDPGDPRIVASASASPPIRRRQRDPSASTCRSTRVGVDHHDAELDAVEHAAAGADATMAIERGTAVAAHHGSQHQQQRREQQDECRATIWSNAAFS